MTTGYKPHPSTIAARALECLRNLQSGQRIATAPLAEALGTDTHTILTGLQPALDAGLVKRDRVDGLFFWSLGAEPASDEPESMPDLVTAPPAAPAEKQAFDGVDIDGPRKEAAPKEPRRAYTRKPKADPVPAPAAAPARQPFMFSCRSDGHITLQKDGQGISLDPAEYKRLHEFVGAVWHLFTPQTHVTEDV